MGAKVSAEATPLERKESSVDEDKRVLRKEIKDWWQGVADHLDRLACLPAYTFLGDINRFFGRMSAS